MVNDPYQVLGISQGASKDEIKRAYRKKAKECHPDLHPNDPKAHERMQQVNEAYDMLMNPGKHQANQQRQQARQNSNPYGQGSYSQYNGYGQHGSNEQQGGYNRGNPYGQRGYGGWQSDDWFDFDIFGFGRQQNYSQHVPPPNEMPGDSPIIRQVIRDVNSGQYQAAITRLNSIPSTGRDARWYYLSSLTNKGLGNNIAAIEQMQRAVQLDPNNQIYHQLLQQYRRNGQTYEQNARNYGMNFDPSKICLGFCAANMLCNCCCCR